MFRCDPRCRRADGWAWLVAALFALGACGADEGGPGGGAGADAPTTTVVTMTTMADPASTAASTTVTAPPPTVGRPGPPAAGQCGVALDDPTPPAGSTVTATVLSSVPGATFLARVAEGATTESGTLDASGSGSVRLRVPGSPAGQPVPVEISVAGGAETCSTTLTPR